MKRVLSLVLVLVLVFGSIMPAFAEETTATPTAGETLETYAVISGSDTGLDEEKVLTRAQFTVILAQLYGMKDTAATYELPSSFTDLAEGAWYVPYVAYAQAQAWMSGHGDGTFTPDDAMSAQQINAAYVKALGHTVEWADVNAKAAELEIAVVAADTTAVLRGEAFTALVLALDVTPFEGTETLGTTLALVNYVAPVVEPVVPEALEVVSVTALNLKEVEVVFNQEVDKTTAETAANYTVTATTAAGPVPTLQADGKTVVIVLTTAATQQELVDFTIADVETAEEVKLASVDFEDITFFDAQIPTALSIELTGPQTFEVTFNEVMTGTPTVLVNNGIYGASFDAWEGRVAKFNLSAALTEADYTVKISAAVDFANYTALAKEFTLTYAKDATVPTVAVDKADQLKVTFKFDEKVKNVTTANFYHTFSGWTATAVQNADGTAIGSGDYVSTVVAVFATSSTVGHPLVAGTNAVTVTVGASGSELQDLWGNKLAAAITFSVEVSADTTAPTVTKVEATDENILKVTFDEAVASATTAANYTIYDADGDVVSTAKTVAYADKVATLTFASDLAAGSYTVKVANVTDASIYANKIVDVTLAFAITDLTAPTTIAAEYVVSGSNYIIYITYPENMDTTTTLVKANYQIGGAALASADTIEIFGDSSKVKITTANNPAGKVITVKNVKDAAANAIGLFDTLTSGALATAQAPVITKVTTTSLNTVAVTFDKHLSAAPAASFVVGTAHAGAPVAVASATYVNNSDTGLTSTVTLTLAADEVLLNEGDAAITIAIVNANVKSFTGASSANHATNDQVAAAGVTPVDGVAPVLVATTPIKTVDAGGNGRIEAITVTYTEDLAPGYYTPATFTVAGYTVTGITEAAGVVTIAVTEITSGTDTDATPVVTQITDLYDVALNKLAAADYTATATTDAVAPVLVVAGSYAVDADADGIVETVYVQYSEDISLENAIATNGNALTLVTELTLNNGTADVSVKAFMTAIALKSGTTDTLEITLTANTVVGTGDLQITLDADNVDYDLTQAGSATIFPVDLATASLTDKVAPVAISAVFADNATDTTWGEVTDTLAITYSEDVVVNFVAADGTKAEFDAEYTLPNATLAATTVMTDTVVNNVVTYAIKTADFSDLLTDAEVGAGTYTITTVAGGLVVDTATAPLAQAAVTIANANITTP